MKSLLVGFILGLLVAPVLAYFYLSSGRFPVATSGPPFPMEKTLASMALDARIKHDGIAQTAIPVSDDNLMAGARVYVDTCSVCHGLGNQAETPTSKGMYPPPPQFFKGKGVMDDPPGETYWKVTNGIRLTGMPGYTASMSDTQRWQVSLFLANANHLPAGVGAYLGTALLPK